MKNITLLRRMLVQSNNYPQCRFLLADTERGAERQMKRNLRVLRLTARPPRRKRKA